MESRRSVLTQAPTLYCLFCSKTNEEYLCEIFLAHILVFYLRCSGLTTVSIMYFYFTIWLDEIWRIVTLIPHIQNDLPNVQKKVRGFYQVMKIILRFVKSFNMIICFSSTLQNVPVKYINESSN